MISFTFRFDVSCEAHGRSRQVEAKNVVLAVVASVAWKGQQHEGLRDEVRRRGGQSGTALAWEKGKGCSWLPSAMVVRGEGTGRGVE